VVECLPSKQVVAGSNPVSRSKPNLATCLTPRSLPVQLARYRLDARARGYGDATIIHTDRCVRAFGTSCGGSSSASRTNRPVTAAGRAGS
jgi:hypothetical protein